MQKKLLYHGIYYCIILNICLFFVSLFTVTSLHSCAICFVAMVVKLLMSMNEGYLEFIQNQRINITFYIFNIDVFIVYLIVVIHRIK